MRELTLQRRLGYATIEATASIRVSRTPASWPIPPGAWPWRSRGRMSVTRRPSVLPRPAPPAVTFRHCDDAEYVAFLAGLQVTQGFRAMRKRYRRAFVERWPTIEDWFAAPFEERARASLW